MGSETLGPSDQTRLSQSNRSSVSALRYPPDAVRRTTGKNAALATPMRALLAASCRSASATSGRRSNKSDGKPAGIIGGLTSQRFVASAWEASLKLDGDSPTR